MRKIRIIVLSLSILIVSSLCRVHAQTDDIGLNSEIDALVANRVKQQQLSYSGMVVGVVYDNANYTYHYGQLDKKIPQAPDGETLFQLGSLSKVLTTSLLLAMVDAGDVQLNDALSQYLPAWVSEQNPQLHNISLQQLSTHTAGLPPIPTLKTSKITKPASNYAAMQIEELYQYLANCTIKNNTNPASFEYSHLGIGLLGHALENASGLTYNKLLRTYLAKHANLSHAYIPNEDYMNDIYAPGHSFSGLTTPKVSYQSLYASEGVYANLNDMLHFLTANMGNNEVLANAQQQKCLTPIENIGAAHGWFVINDSKEFPAITTHSGCTAGYSNYIAFSKERGIGVVILSNSANRIDDLGIDILEFLLQDTEQSKQLAKR